MSGFEVLVPVKRLTDAKQRLRPVLNSGARAGLMSEMAAQVLRAVLEARAAASVFVVTPDPSVAALAGRLGAEALPDPGLGLNAALEQAVALRLAAGAEAIAIVQGDLPWLDAAAVDAVLALAAAPGEAALAPDQHRRGTSMLAWRGPPHLTRFAFGEDSFARHGALVAAAGLTLASLTPDKAFHDVDDAGDLEGLEAIEAFVGPTQRS